MNQNLQNLFLREVLEKVYKLTLPISGGGGSGIEDAIIINLDNEKEAIDLEYKIMNAICVILNKKPQFERQENLVNESRHYDKLVFTLEGEIGDYELYFDITQSFGKSAKTDVSV